MSSKRTTYISLFLILLFAIGYLMAANAIPKVDNSTSLGPNYFPNAIGALLIVFCLISFFQTRKKADETIPFANVRLVLLTIGFTVLFFLSWNVLGYFYVNCILFLIALLTMYSWKRENIQWLIGKNALIALSITGSVYLFFDFILDVNF